MESPMRNLPTNQATCEVHGEFSSVNYIRDRWSGCPKCAQDEEKRRMEEKQQQERRERAEVRLRRSGLIGRFLEVGFDDYEVTTPAQQKVLDACRNYAATVSFNGGAGMWLIGPPGTGKTHLGSAMVRAVIEDRDQGACIFSGREIIRLLRSTWGNKERGRTWDGWATTEDQMIDDFGHVGLMVIDEIGVGFGSDSEHVQLFDVIDLRYKYNRPTVLLSNLAAKGLKEAMGDRAYDRLREGVQVLACQWDSHRGRNSQKPAPLEVVRKRGFE